MSHHFSHTVIGRQKNYPVIRQANQALLVTRIFLNVLKNIPQNQIDYHIGA